jgi:AraC family transcriptional regulator
MDAVLPPSGAAGIDPGSSAILARLLTDAFEALDDDIERVRGSLSRAVALVSGASTPEAANGQGGLAAWQARKISALVEERLAYGVRTPELAASAGLSKSHFSRAFKAHFGRSPQQYILEKRVARAQRLMLERGSRLSGVAQACGFADQAHLCRVFRCLVGASPHSWRRAHSPPT